MEIDKWVNEAEESPTENRPTNTRSIDCWQDSYPHGADLMGRPGGDNMRIKQINQMYDVKW